MGVKVKAITKKIKIAFVTFKPAEESFMGKKSTVNIK